MKKLTMVSMLFFVFGNAQAGTEKEFDRNATELLSVVFNHCPIHFIQAMDGANRVGKAHWHSYSDDEIGTTTEVYTIVTVAGGYAPSFKSFDVATLRITRKIVNKPSHGGVDRPSKWNTTCKLVPSEK